MLEIFVYPVSAVMKLWHLVLHDLIGVEDSAAWVISIIGLVVTVRALITPINWAMKRSSRRAILMRPELAELQAKYGDSTDPADVYALEDGTRELHRKYNYRPAAGCIPTLIQLPVLLGLYRMLLWMARPESREDADAAIGVLSPEEIASFLDADIGGVPVQAYLAMSDQRLAALGTTTAEVRSFVVPFLLAAVVFTAVNLIIGLFFNWRTLHWASGISRGLFKVIAWLTVILPIFLLLFGLFGPVPVALIFYWFCNTLWTMVQNAIMNPLAEKRWPESEEHRAKRAEDRAAVYEQRAEAKREREWIAEKKREARRNPGQADEIRAEVATYREEKKAAAKAEKKARRERSAAQARARTERRRREREARKRAKDNGDAAEDGRAD